MIKIGDKVRFLNEVGEGKVVGFQSKQVALVEDLDSFERPMLIKELVVVPPTNQYNFPVENKPAARPSLSKSLEAKEEEEEEETEPVLPPYHFNESDETKEGEKLSLFLMFVPKDMKKIQTTDFDLYLINDCNYYVQFQLMEGKQSKGMIMQDVVEPQTKLFVKTIERTAVNDFEFLHFQGFAFKDHFFDLKPCVDLEVRVKPTSFYKLHNFKETDYFYDPAMIVGLIEKDVYNFGQNIQAQDIQQALKAKESEPLTRERIQQHKKVKDEPLVIDLHATEILDSTKGLEPKDILNYKKLMQKEQKF